MRVNFTETSKKTIDIEVKLPYYSKGHAGSVFNKVISKEKVIRISDFGFSVAINLEISDRYVEAAFESTYEPISQEEFDKAYAIALEKLTTAYGEEAKDE